MKVSLAAFSPCSRGETVGFLPFPGARLLTDQ
jgi:hypothetical protein